MSPLYVVVRNDIGAGLQMAQACHVTREFTRVHSAEPVGESLIVLEASPAELAELFGRAGAVRRTAFHEPDLGGELTAVAFGAGARKLLSSLPLAGRLRDAA